MFAVPQQENGFDCGLFVCRYLYGLVYLHKEQQKINLSTIEDSHLFKFTQDDISRMRKEFAILLNRLTIYSSEIDEYELERKRDRLQRKRDREVARLRDVEESCAPNTSQISHIIDADDNDPVDVESGEISKSLLDEATSNARTKSKMIDDPAAAVDQQMHPESSPTKPKEVKGQATTVDEPTNAGSLAVIEKDLKALKVPALKKLCNELGIMKKSSSYIKKKDLIQAIMDHYN